MEFIHNGFDIPDAPPKDPNSVADYGCDWSAWLQTGETISVSAWVIQAGLTQDSDVNSGVITGVTLSGGTEYDEYLITNRITTSLGRIEDRSMKIFCRNK